MTFQLAAASAAVLLLRAADSFREIRPNGWRESVHALIQIGNTAGILMPLIVPGYSPWVFLGAIAFCAVAAALLSAHHSVRCPSQRESSVRVGPSAAG